MEALAPCLSLLTSLQHLSVAWNCFQEDCTAVETLSACLGCFSGLQHLAVALWEEGQAALLAPCLSTLKALRHLDMAVGKGGAVALAGSLRCLTALQYLDLTGSDDRNLDDDDQFGAAGGAALATSL